VVQRVSPRVYAAGDRRPAHANRLLGALPAESYNRIAPALVLVPLKLKEFLHKPTEIVRHVYFPGFGGFCSVLTVLSDGRMVEVATIGREGMVGASLVLDARAAEPSATMVQVETKVCYRLAADAFDREMKRQGAFAVLMTRYAQALVGFIMQGTACNAVHTVEQRLARWLLTAQDRVQANVFPLTQELVAMMLGATRQTVTVVAGTLQRSGLITYQRGHVTIVDRGGLESACCECYGTATALLDGVTGKR
jgi:CRP-like cAMP-binding protein